jgi:D-serine deaminase-like pyridoxal phosphate-dependent protein
MRIDELDTPCVLVDLDVLERNISRAQEYLDRHRISMRPHIKTHKIPEIARLQVAAGAVGITCAKVGEAEVMADAGIEDLLIAYPILGDAKLKRLAALAARARVAVAFDSEEIALGLSRAAREAGVTIGALVETDTGTHRCGVAPGPSLVALCRRAAELPGLEFQGVMTYQGYLWGSPEERAAGMREEGERIRRLLEELDADGIHPEVVSGASSPNLFLAHLLPGVNENRCGSYVFNDRNTVATGAVGWEDCAVRVAVTVVSTAVPGQLIIDGGAKTFSTDRLALDGGPGFGHVVEDPELTLVKMNEEHGFVRLGSPAASDRRAARLGDRLHLIPNHVCMTINMHDEVYIHRGGRVVDTWRVAARGRIR